MCFVVLPCVKYVGGLAVIWYSGGGGGGGGGGGISGISGISGIRSSK